MTTRHADTAPGADAALEYPPTPIDPVIDTLHGVAIPDPYRWLEDDDSPAVREWTDRQNALTRARIDRFRPVYDRVTHRLEALYAATVPSSPTVAGRRFFFEHRSGLQNQPVVYVRDNGHRSPARPLIDPNRFSADGTVALDWLFPSPDGSLVVYGRSASGSELSDLHVRDVTTGEDLDLAISRTRFCAVAWDEDGRGFIYTRYPDPASVAPGDENYYRFVYYHRLGSPLEEDILVFGPGRPREEMSDPYTSSDHRWQFLSASSIWTRNDLFFRRAGDPRAPFEPLVTGLDGHFSADVEGDTLILLTDWQAPRGRVLVADVRNPAREAWREIIPQQDWTIRGVKVIGGKLILSATHDVSARLFIYSLEGQRLGEVKLPTLGTLSEVSGSPQGHELFFGFQSFAFPPTNYRYDLQTGELEVLDRLELGIDPPDFEVRQVWFASKDGTRVPMYVVARAGLDLNGDNPTLLYGYGGFDVSLTPALSRLALVWLEQGGIYVVANIRGGGEFGRAWHQGGRLELKQNVFDDFIAAAETLIGQGYTRPDRLGIMGGSNGGLLMGAMLTQRPDLFRAVVCQVPLLDMLRYHLFSIARLWIQEYGGAEDPDQFRTLLAYSPYHRLGEGTVYPAALFTTAEADTRVAPLHARKMAARMQALTGNPRPVLLRVETRAGHGAGKPVSKVIATQADELTFLMAELGMIGPADRERRDD